MTAQPLAPVPSPPSHWWRQFRIKLHPVLVFLGVLATTIWLWRQNLVNPLLVGTAVGDRAAVISPQAGRLARLDVSLYKSVRVGDPVALVEAVDPMVLSNRVRVIQAEMKVIVTDAGFRTADKLRYGQYQLDWLRERADLAVARAELRYAQNEYERIARLAQEGTTSESNLDQAKMKAESARQLVAEKEASVDTAGKLLQQLDPAQRDAEPPSVKAALAVAEERLRLVEAELQPILLTSPIEGIVSEVLKYPGGIVASAEPIVTVVSTNVDRIVGFVPQPLRFEPKQGMAVEVRSRGLHRDTGLAQITHVGPRIELFDAPLRARGMGNAQQRGLPVVLNVPSNLRLRPGELVDLAILEIADSHPQPN